MRSLTLLVVLFALALGTPAVLLAHDMLVRMAGVVAEISQPWRVPIAPPSR